MRFLFIILLVSSANAGLLNKPTDNPAYVPPMDTIITITVNGEDTTRSMQIQPQRDYSKGVSHLGTISAVLIVQTLLLIGVSVYTITESNKD